MPRPALEVAAELRTIMMERDGRPFSILWANFYDMCERLKWTEKATAEIKEATQEVGIVLGFGKIVVTVAKDQDFAPLDSWSAN